MDWWGLFKGAMTVLGSVAALVQWVIIWYLINKVDKLETQQAATEEILCGPQPESEIDELRRMHMELLRAIHGNVLSMANVQSLHDLPAREAERN